MYYAHKPSNLINFEMPHLNISVDFGLKLAEKALLSCCLFFSYLTRLSLSVEKITSQLCYSPSGPLPLMSV